MAACGVRRQRLVCDELPGRQVQRLGDRGHGLEKDPHWCGAGLGRADRCRWGKPARVAPKLGEELNRQRAGKSMPMEIRKRRAGRGPPGGVPQRESCRGQTEAPFLRLRSRWGTGADKHN